MQGHPFGMNLIFGRLANFRGRADTFAGHHQPRGAAASPKPARVHEANIALANIDDRAL
jgi:hypothetical protein